MPAKIDVDIHAKVPPIRAVTPNFARSDFLLGIRISFKLDNKINFRIAIK